MEEVVFVAAIKAGQIITGTSCDRSDAQRYAKYYRGIGYKSRVMTYEELEEFEEKYKKECQEAEYKMMNAV